MPDDQSQQGQIQEADDMIVFREVHKWFGDFHVLKGVNIKIGRGEVVVVFGPSGSGKSTFIRTINRLEEHQRGQIVVDGVELTHDIRHIEAVRRDVGMVFKSFNLFQNLSGWAYQSRRGSTLRSFPAASSNGWPLPGRWPCAPR